MDVRNEKACLFQNYEIPTEVDVPPPGIVRLEVHGYPAPIALWAAVSFLVYASTVIENSDRRPQRFETLF